MTATRGVGMPYSKFVKQGFFLARLATARFDSSGDAFVAAGFEGERSKVSPVSDGVDAWVWR